MEENGKEKEGWNCYSPPPKKKKKVFIGRSQRLTDHNRRAKEHGDDQL